MKQAIVQIQGKQFLVSKDQEILIDNFDQEEGTTLKITDVVLVTDGTSTQVGQPLVEGASVTVKVMSDQKGKKIRVATYKSKSKSRRVKGHRSHFTRLLITDVTLK